ncbi:hypothetical protein FBX97_3479 [Herbaspirillum sp. SJZ107]|nr:hypothetical protein FBX97_3479 [Herbaspirillum sp. SJZ107]
MAKIPNGGQPDGPNGTEGAPIPVAGDPPGRRVGERKKRFLVTPQPAPEGLSPFGLSPFALGSPGVQPLTLQSVEQALRAAPDIEVVGTVGTASTRSIGLMESGMSNGNPGGTLVARMTDDKARALLQQAQGRLVVERDQHLHLLDPVPRHPTLVNSFAAYDGPHFDIDLVVLGKDGVPLGGAEVSLFGGLLPAAGLTDDQGRLTLTVHGDSPHTVTGLYVKPRADYWSFYQRDPDLAPGEPNVVGLQALSDWPQMPGFPGRSTVCWGARDAPGPGAALVPRPGDPGRHDRLRRRHHACRPQPHPRRLRRHQGQLRDLEPGPARPRFALRRRDRRLRSGVRHPRLRARRRDPRLQAVPRRPDQPADPGARILHRTPDRRGQPQPRRHRALARAGAADPARAAGRRRLHRRGRQFRRAGAVSGSLALRAGGGGRRQDRRVPARQLPRRDHPPGRRRPGLFHGQVQLLRPGCARPSGWNSCSA